MNAAGGMRRGLCAMLVALVMGATMSVITLAYMLGMYKKRMLNLAIFVQETTINRG